ncbi:ribosomal protein S18-alanine N-acetyltransferase [Gammaproteobacteria bacterium]|nr:ribosomal protein S18-alanine N-acetyltransferase [Gammaproteobacteria bacterium]MDC1474843.1 ribosomal protein S18-alanine N-acetyltransferase [Gammaproteobacteria bacterium]MDC1526124.1 ribosomal protein S18-alanine N-acetyltransferase [Gammaproteobacteria bacterium]
MKIRPSSSDDLSAILKIESLTNQIPWTKQQFLSSEEVGHYSVVLEAVEGVIAFAIYSPIIPESHLLNIAVAPSHQGQGHGRYLLQKVILQNKTLGVQSLTLEVRVSNRSAIALYESEGFLKDAIRPNYYSGKTREDALLMSLAIK